MHVACLARIRKNIRGWLEKIKVSFRANVYSRFLYSISLFYFYFSFFFFLNRENEYPNVRRDVACPCLNVVESIMYMCVCVCVFACVLCHARVRMRESARV